MNATTYSKEIFINWLVGGEDMPPSPGSVYLSLHSENPGENGDQNEITANDYDRVEVQVSEWDIGSGVFENDVLIEFPTAETDWGTITYFSVWDGPASSDNPLGSSQLASSAEIREGDTPVFRDGRLAGDLS